MARIIPINMLRKSLAIELSYGPVYVRLIDVQTSYLDRDTGWHIKSNDVKQLPSVMSQSLVKAINCGRFVKVQGPKSKKSKGKDLVEYIIQQNEKREKEKAKEGG